MVHQITDTQRQVTVNIPPWKRLFIILAIVCTIAGLLVGGYFAFFNKATPTATIPQPPVQPNPLPPVIATTPTQPANITPALTTPAPAPPQKLEVKWETGGPKDAGGILAVSIDDNKGEIIYAVGKLPNISRALYVWKSNDSGNSWKFLGRITDPEINFKDKEQIYHDFEVYAIVDLFASKRDPNNKKIILEGRQSDEYPPDKAAVGFRLSLDDGKSWLTLNLPPGWKPEGNIILSDKHHFDLISSNGTLKVFLTAGQVWQTTINLPTQ